MCIRDRALVVANPMPYLARYTGGQLAEASHHMKIGIESVGQRQLLYDLTDIMPNESSSRA
eukprot:1603778-Karenia_brevis.AAC.1